MFSLEVTDMWQESVSFLDLALIVICLRTIDVIGMSPYRKWAKRSWESDGKKWPWWAS